MTAASERQRQRRERLHRQGLTQVTVTVPNAQRERVKHIASALRDGIGVSARLIEALAVLRENRDKLAAYGAERAGIFGSVARGDDRPDSDIDVVVSFSGESAYDPFNLVGMRRIIVQAFQERFPDTEVDVSFYPMMKARVRRNVDAEAVYAYA